jgi:pimeloyl-ACP methyl ester carboxylesterase
MVRFWRGAAAVAAAALLIAGRGSGGGSGGGDDERAPRAHPSASAGGRTEALSEEAGPLPSSPDRADAALGPLQGRQRQGAGRRMAVQHDEGPAGLREAGRQDDRHRPDPREEHRQGLPHRLPGLQFRRRQRYDLVSFDPRGVGASEGVRCRSDRQIQASQSVDVTPDTPAEEKAYFKDAADFSAGCERAAGSLLPHLSTADTARDMDLMRGLLGDRKLHYFGISYGTELGGVYAHLFPRHVGRLALDAVVDPTADLMAQEKNETRGFQHALDNYLKSTGQDPQQGTKKIADLLKQLDTRPLPTSSGRKLNQSLALFGISGSLYSKQSWPDLTKALRAAGDGDGTRLLKLADPNTGRMPNGHYTIESHARRAISCRDNRLRPTPAQAKKELGAFRAISPVFGDWMAWDSAGWCHDWPVPGLADTPDVSAPGAPPVLVVGNTGDPATPYQGARKMADALGKGVGVELTWKGQGHGAYRNGSSCVDGTMNAYLIDGKVPKDGKVCSS